MPLTLRGKLRRAASMLALVLVALATAATSQSTCFNALVESDRSPLLLSTGDSRHLTLEVHIEGGDRAWSAHNRLSGRVSAPADGPCEVAVYLRRRDSPDHEESFGISADAGTEKSFSWSLAELMGNATTPAVAVYDLTFVAMRGSPTITPSASVFIEAAVYSENCPDEATTRVSIGWDP